MSDDELIRAAEDAGIPRGYTHIDVDKLRIFAQIIGDKAIEEYCEADDTGHR